MDKQIIFGGAFNPPHVEHQSIVKFAKDKLGLSRAVIIPSYFPPHKNGAKMLDYDMRIEMCKLAFPGEIISDIESKLDQKSYAINTVRALKAQNPNVEYFYAIGGDSMADLFKWYKPEELLKEVSLVVYPRESKENECNDAIKKAVQLGGKIIKLDSFGQNISSGELRCLCALRQNVSNFLPSTVVDYIKKHDLYKSDLVEHVKAKLPEKTFAHVVRTAVWALELNRKIGLSPQVVFESAMMHDVEKNSLSQKGVPIDALDSPVAHQFAGAESAREYGLDDCVVSAIMYHTTAKPEMNQLEMLIYSADMTEKARDFEGVDLLREKLKNNLTEGFKACLKHSYEYLKSQNKNIHHLTKDAYEFYLN